MPIYEYACQSCGHRFETRQSFSDAPLTDCPECGAPVRRVLHPAGVIFKGSGWYKTDSRPKSDTSENGSASKDTSDSAKAAKPAEAKSSESTAASPSAASSTSE